MCSYCSPLALPPRCALPFRICTTSRHATPRHATPPTSAARQAGEAFRKTILDARRLCDQLVEARALGNLGSVYELLGDTPKAIVTSELCVTKLRSLPEDQRRKDKEAVILGNLANSHINIGQYDAALGCLDDAIELEAGLGQQESVQELTDRREHVQRLMEGTILPVDARSASREKRLSIDRGSQDQIAMHIRRKILASRVRRRWQSKVQAHKAEASANKSEMWKRRAAAKGQSR